MIGQHEFTPLANSDSNSDFYAFQAGSLPQILDMLDEIRRLDLNKGLITRGLYNFHLLKRYLHSC